MVRIRRRCASSSLPSACSSARRCPQLGLDGLDGPLHGLVAGHVVGGGEHDQLLDLLPDVAGEGVEAADPLHLVAEQLDAHGLLLVGGVELDGVAPHPEVAPGEHGVVAVVVEVHQLAQQVALVDGVAGAHHEDPLAVLLGRPQAVDARHRRHHDDVAPQQQARGGGVAEPVDLVVDRRVLLDVGVGGREVRLGLVVVVVRHEVLDPVVREQLLQLGRQLGRQGLVGLDDEGGALDRLDRPGDGGGLAAAGDAEQGLVAVAALDALGQQTRWPAAGRPAGRSGVTTSSRGTVRSYRGGVISPIGTGRVPAAGHCRSGRAVGGGAAGPGTGLSAATPGPPRPRDGPGPRSCR